MDLFSLFSVIGFCLSILGFFGWSHRALRAKLDEMETEIDKISNAVISKPSEEKVRLLINDKMAVAHADISSLSKQLDALSKHQEALNLKLDAVLNICAKIQAGRRD